jgi:hypothetical protein
VYSYDTRVCNFPLDGTLTIYRLSRAVHLGRVKVNKWLAAAGLALVILTGAMGLQTVAGNLFAHTSDPVPPVPPSGFYAHTSAPVPPVPPGQ